MMERLSQEAPSLIPALKSGKYYIKWKQLSNLPAPLYNAYTAIQQNRIYVTGGYSPAEDAMQSVHVYDMSTDCWNKLPLSGHYCGIPHIIGGRLVLIGGRLSSTKKITNKVSTFYEASQTWISYYPDLLSARHRPGVATHLEYIIVAGGADISINDEKTMLDDIEVLDWTKNIQWKKISLLLLPRPMNSFTPIISGEYFMIIGYWVETMAIDNSVFQISVSDIVQLISGSNAKPDPWTQLTSVVHYGFRVAPVLSCCQPVVLGGYQDTLSTSDIKIYDFSDHKWKVIGSLSFARCAAGVVAVNDNAIIVIGGCVRGHSRPDAMSSSLITVELGQAELIKPSILPF
ncbi:influenza virus NS1A-binding protein homolog B-like isoform X2 [Dysidea avara]|uniref:influenza virus NS1A-binding protein homolog B-like isoform X2 n=1 Tax=Dysidea avara TaxID=196820 RepID=UPI0033327DAB